MIRRSDLFQMSIADLRKVRDSTKDLQQWCLINACIRLREAMQKKRSADVEIWQHIVNERLKDAERI